MPSIRDKASSSLKKAASVIGIETAESNESSSSMEDLAEICPKLTYQQRMIGFGTCFVLGYVITFISFSFFFDLIDGDPVPFVLMYSVGNIVALMSSMFLCGPKRQFNNMFDDKRKVTTIVYLSTLFAAIVLCFLPVNINIKLPLLVLLLLVQCGASFWYSLSYIPFGRKAVKKCFKNQTGLDEV